MAGTNDFDAIRKNQYAHRGADEIVTVDQGVGDQLFPDDTRNFGFTLGVEPLFALCGTCVGNDETQRLLEDIGQFSSDVAAVDVALILDLGTDKGDSLYDESR